MIYTKHIEKFEIFDMDNRDSYKRQGRDKSKKKIQTNLNNGWKIKSQIMLDEYYLSIVFEKEEIIK